MHLFNGSFIPVHKASQKTFLLNEIDDMIKKVELSEEDFKNLLVSDASETAYCYTTDSRIVLVIDHKFTEEERLLSSSRRELRAIQLTLESQGEAIKKFKSPIVYWQTDSHNAKGFLLKQMKARSFHLLQTNGV